jgi:hypothetical protein
LVGAALGVGVVAFLVVVSERGGAPSRIQFTGSDFTSPHETPFSHAEQVDLATAIADGAFRIIRPHHLAASDESITEVWLQRASPQTEGTAQVALWYASGLELHLSRVSANDPDPLSADFPDGFPVSYETLGDTPIRVIPPGIQGEGQPGSVTMVRDGVFISLFGWLTGFDADQLREIAGPLTDGSTRVDRRTSRLNADAEWEHLPIEERGQDGQSSPSADNAPRTPP